MSFTESVAVIGGGNWGTAIAKKIGQNLLSRQTASEQTNSLEGGVVVWIYEEIVDGQKLTEVINTTHENSKYLPNILLPPNVRASSDLAECAVNKKIIFFAIPHQFLRNIIYQLRNLVASDTICVSLMKGIEASLVTHEIKRFTTIIEEELGVSHCAAVMGANVATDVALDHFAEATIGCLNRDSAIAIAELLECDLFRTEITFDVSTVEWCGALKNIYALGAGFCDGMGLGANAKAALLRQSLKEMTEFCHVFDQTGHFKIDTLLRSCGVADLIATSYGGRNRKCAAEFYQRSQKHQESLEGQSRLEFASHLWAEIERELLQGQKLQGVSTCHEVVAFLQTVRYWEKHPDRFPLLKLIHGMISTANSFDRLFHYHHAVHFLHR